MTVFVPANVTTADTLYTGTVTITTTQTSTSTIPSAQALILPTDPRILLKGAGDFITGTAFPDTVLWQPTSRYGNSYGSPSAWAVEFIHTGQTFEYLFKHAAASMYRIKIDGKRLTDLTQPTNGTTVGSRHLLKFDFGSVGTRRIQITSSVMPFGGIYIGPTDTLAAPPAPNARMICMGDSITGGSAQNTGVGAGTWPWRLGPYLGVDDPWNSGVGASGYVAPGTSVTFGTRAQRDVIQYNPKVVIVWGGYNDNLLAQADISAAASSLYDALRTGLPTAELYVIGCWSPYATAPAPVVNTDETLRREAASAGLPFISPVTGNVYDTAGNRIAALGPWIASTADVSAYIGTDNVHPTDAGHQHIASKMRDALAAANPAATVLARQDFTANGFDDFVLTAVATDSNGNPLSVTWTQTSGSPTGLLAAGANAGVAPATMTGGTYDFLATATVNGTNYTDSTRMTVNPHNHWRRNAAGNGWTARRRSKRVSGAWADANPA
jgi:lysophospholipase L1-like esterase